MDLAHLSEGRIRVTAKGRMVLNAIIRDLAGA
jgi:hypothetical protein